MTDTYKLRLGRLEGRTYTLVVRATPSRNEPRDFSVSLVCNGQREVVRIDNSHGKGPQIHRLYRRDEKEEPVDMEMWEAADHI